MYGLKRALFALLSILIFSSVCYGAFETEALYVTGLTNVRLIATGSDSDKDIVSVVNLCDWIAGTTNQITCTDDADGTITLSTPQDIHTGASPTFVGLTTTGARVKNEIRITSADSPYTVLATDHIIFCDSDAAIEIDYPAGTSGRELIIKGVGSGGFDCTLDPNGAEEIFSGGAGVAFVMHDGEVFDTHYNSTEGWR